MRVSDHLKVISNQCVLDFLDVNLNFDNPLYLDPLKIANINSDFGIQCQRKIDDFFSFLMTTIDNNEQDALELLMVTDEPYETCLGVGRGDPKSGKSVREKKIKKIIESVRKSKARESGFLNDFGDFTTYIPLIGFDNVSDILTCIIRKELLDYTKTQCLLYGFTTINEISNPLVLCQ